jgi:hypothetical protein
VVAVRVSGPSLTSGVERERGIRKDTLLLRGMSGALKHFFDTVYYPCLDSTRGRPFGLYVHGNNDTTGAVRGVEAATTGLGWEKAAQHVLVTGEPSKAGLEACWELGATVAAQLST